MADDDGGNRMLWFIAGAALGVSAAMLLAPLTGEQTRRKIAEKTGQGKTALAESGKDVFERGRELFERGQKLVDEAAEMFDRGRRLVEGTAAVFQKATAPPQA